MISKQYLAGFIDGEGYLGIMKHTNKTKRGYSYVPCIKIAQTVKQREVIDIIHKMYGGHIDKIRGHHSNRNDSVTIAIKGRVSIRKLLEDISEFLIVKKHQAKILSDFLDIPVPTTRIPGIVDIEMNKMYESKEKLYLAIRKLNQRGKIGLAETE
jgi:hypothetical protein